MGDDRPACYYEDDTLIIRASSIGSSCLWELVAAGQDYPPSAVPAFLQRAFDDGHTLEPIIIGMLEERGHSIYGAQEEAELVINPTLKIRYHPDGMMVWKDNESVLEIKALSDILWQKAARWSVGDCIEEYKWQISAMMHHKGKPAVWVAYNKGNSDGSNCPDQGRLLYETVLEPPISLDEIRSKAEQIKKLVDGGDLLESGRPCDNPKQFPCRYLHLRPEPNEGWLVMDDETVDSSTPVLPPQIDATLAVDDEDKAKDIDYLVREYLMNKGLADEAKAKQDAARDKLIEYARNHKKIMTDHWLIPVIRGTNTSPDWASMPEDIRTEAKKYVKRTHYHYIQGIKNLGEE